MATWMAISGLASAQAQHDHAHATMPGMDKAAKSAELGTSAAVDSKGRLWVVSKETAAEGQYVTVQVSGDHGKTWSAPVRAQQKPEAVSAEGENRPKIAFGPHDELFITYTKPLAKPYTGDIRFLRSIDGGKHFSEPVTLHANRDIITHRFESIIVDRSGRIYATWIDKRDVEAAAARKQKYTGAAMYYAVSDDNGASFRGDYKIADHSCECCRIALALNPAGNPVAMWRHVFEPNVRDHASVELTPHGKLAAPTRVTFDDWRIDACPHQGPSIAYSVDGTRHQTWFNVKDGEGGVFYATESPEGKRGMPLRLGSALAQHADVAVDRKQIAVVWKQFDGQSTGVFGRLSSDEGKSWQELELGRTQGASDQPHVLATPAGIVVIWRTQRDGLLTLATSPGTGS